MKYLFCLLILLLATPSLGWCCTIFQIKNPEGVFIGHSFDWSSGNGMVMLNKRGVKKEAFAGMITEAKPAKWISKYGSITVGWIAPELPTAGINEKGLLIAGLLADGQKYSTTGTLPAISSSQWKQYLLDTSSSVDEALTVLKKIRIVPTSKFHQHFFLADAEGKVAVVEYLNGKPKIYTGEELPISALTDTLYEPALEHLSKNQRTSESYGTTSLFSDAVRRMRITVQETSKITKLPNKDSQTHTFHILDKVKRSNTQWQLVYDLKKVEVFWRTNQKDFHTISLSNQSLNCGPPEIISISEPHKMEFKPYDNESKINFITSANRILRLPKRNYVALLKYPSTLSCAATLNGNSNILN